MKIDNYWHKLSSKTILEDLYAYQMRLVNLIVDFGCNNKKICEVDSVVAWIENSKFEVERFDSFIEDLKLQKAPDLSVFVVTLNRLKSLIN